ncbi:MAG TPA: diguanylate cyclase [Candidatus Limnocylindrales bacterium]|nr:diguanylate cyclase [Candidatus Limnocylindrales bacterium]
MASFTTAPGVAVHEGATTDMRRADQIRRNGAATTMAIYPEWVGTDGGPADTAAAAVESPSEDRTAPADVDEGDETPARAIPIVEAPVPPPSGWADALTGTDGPHYWDRLIISETARVRRYKRPATVVLVEIAGLTRLGELWGTDVAERTLISAARTLSQSIRTSDHIARIEPIRFGIMLTETTEIDAINFIERARVSCERDLRVASEVVGVAFGWASPPKGNDLADAVGLAQQRLAAELKTL